MGRVRTLLVATVLALLAPSAPAGAEDLTCDDIIFKPRATNEFPSVAQSCNSVVERDDGRLYVRLVADVVRVEDESSIVVDLKGRDGSRIRQVFHAPPGFRASIAGKLTPARDLRRGQEIRLYLPADWWDVAGSTETDGGSAAPTG